MEEDNGDHNINLGLRCFSILIIISLIGLWIEDYFNIGFNFLGLGHVTFIPFLIGVTIDFLIVNKVKKSGNFIKGKFWLGFFIPLIVVLLVYGACAIMMSRLW
jgi:hypothetical protein